MKQTDDYHLGILLKEVNDRLKKVQGVLSGLKELQANIRHIKRGQSEMKELRSVTQFVIKDQSMTLNNHEARLTTLETA
jgi:hypothetical protein